jgi:hypothetical protein
MDWFVFFGFAALGCWASYVIGDYRGFKRGKEGSYELWCSRMARENGTLIWPPDSGRATALPDNGAIPVQTQSDRKFCATHDIRVVKSTVRPDRLQRRWVDDRGSSEWHDVPLTEEGLFEIADWPNFPVFLEDVQEC